MKDVGTDKEQCWPHEHKSVHVFQWKRLVSIQTLAMQLLVACVVGKSDGGRGREGYDSGVLVMTMRSSV